MGSLALLRKILVPLDGSELAEGILPYVAQLAKGLDIPLVLLTVMEPDSLDEGPAPQITKRLNEAAKRLQVVASRLRDDGVAAK